MPVHQPVRSERVIDVETLDRMHHENRQAVKQPITSAEIDNNID